MAIARSRISPQGQVSVPAEVRQKLGLAPGSVIEWDERGGEILVRRAGGSTFDDLHKALFPGGPPPAATVDQMNDAIAEYLADKHARR
jgi:AbrB family looped-hinge helix DNA binding protein